MSGRLQGKRALVTGDSRGIGEGIRCNTISPGVGDTPASFTVGEQVDISSGPCPPAPAPGCNSSFETASLSVVDRGGAKEGGKGDALPLPSLPLTAPLVVQHRTLDGTCAEVVFDTLSKNEPGKLKGKLR